MPIMMATSLTFLLIYLSAWHAAATQVVDLVSVWRQRVADAYHGGSIERCMEESGMGGVKVLMLSLMDNELARPGGWGEVLMLMVDAGADAPCPRMRS
jgi:hypothetical protein